jgi:hypothetical protein
MKKSGLPAREALFYTNIQILKDILNKGGLEMSKKPVLIDILKRGDRQNVQETSFNRHFEEG